MATKKIVIVGRDADAWITALFLKSSLGKWGTDIEIELLELNSNLTADDFYSVLPSYKNLHNALGASEKKLTKMAQAHYFVGQQFTGWNADGKEYIHAYDDLGVNFKGIDFYQYWHKAQINGFKVPLEDFCFGAAAAKYGSFEYDLQKSENIPLVYGYHLAATPYLSEVARAALSLGVKHHQGSIKQVNIDNDRIISIETTAGDIFQSDIFIDASGADALLINQLSHSQREDWSHWFRCDKVVTASGPALNPNPSFSRITAFHLVGMACSHSKTVWVLKFIIHQNIALRQRYLQKYHPFAALLLKVIVSERICVE